jgi:protein-disulfide isomerase
MVYKSSMLKKHFWKIAGLTAVVLLLGSLLLSQKAAEKANEGVIITPHVKGNVEANVTLTEYSDFQCPACGQAHPFVKEIVQAYGDRIKFEYKHFPLVTIHPYALSAARAAEAAGEQGKFWEMHDKLFENQSTWSSSRAVDAVFVSYAEELGLDTTLFKQHYNAPVITDAIKTSYNEALSKGLSGTPSFFLNDQKIAFTSYDDLRAQIEAALTVNGEAAVTPSTDIGVEFGI